MFRNPQTLADRRRREIQAELRRQRLAAGITYPGKPCDACVPVETIEWREGSGSTPPVHVEPEGDSMVTLPSGAGVV
ncbi:hypothetical protein [Microbaculum marinum]|uniref:Uncharacterized protein n=1 Tax=Microbaculum marinum TaxID=1764581 RepID=A0AAW9RMR9_9HYPH